MINNASKLRIAKTIVIIGACLGINWTKTKVRIPKPAAVTAVQNRVFDRPWLLYKDTIY